MGKLATVVVLTMKPPLLSDSVSGGISLNHCCGEEIKWSKLKDEDIFFIRNNHISRDKNFGTRGLSRKFNVAHTTIQAVINNETWKHV